MDAPLVHQLSRQWQKLGSHVRNGEPLKASKRETSLEIRFPYRPLVDYELDRPGVEAQ